MLIVETIAHLRSKLPSLDHSDADPDQRDGENYGVAMFLLCMSVSFGPHPVLPTSAFLDMPRS